MTIRHTRHVDAGATTAAGNRIRLLARQVTTLALDLLFPPHCVVCQRVGSLFCASCAATIVPAPARSISGLDAICVCGTYEAPLSIAIHALKYQRIARVADALAALLADVVAANGWEFDAVCPVPLHPNRIRSRGFNQAALLASAAGRRLDRPVFDAAERVRDTATQTDLSASERHTNVAGAFVGRIDLAHDIRFLLIDDVLTTGSTISACAAALRDAGASHVCGGVIASAVLR